MIKINRLVLAPYYKSLLFQQGLHVMATEQFKAAHGGKNRYEYENGI